MHSPPTKRPADLGSGGPDLKSVRLRENASRSDAADGFNQADAQRLIEGVCELRDLHLQWAERVVAEQDRHQFRDHAELCDCVAIGEAILELLHTMTPATVKEAS
jgi:hypothetical protein